MRPPKPKNIRQEYAALLRREGDLLAQLRKVRAAMPPLQHRLIQSEERSVLGIGTGRQPIRDVEDLTPEEWKRRAEGMVNAIAAEAVMLTAREKGNVKIRQRSTANFKARARKAEAA